MRIRRCSPAACVLALCASLSLAHGAPPPKVPPKAGPDLATALEDIRAKEQLPGIILAVQRPGGVLETYAAGVVDRGTKRRFTGREHFYIGSVTKMYTAALVLDLLDDGLLGLDDPLARHVPEFPGADKITLRHLLNQTSGLADFEVKMYFEPSRAKFMEALTRKWTVEQMLEFAGGLKPEFPPGAAWAYSNTNYLLLAVVAERVAKKPFAAALRERILAPLGLEHTWLAFWEPPRGAIEITGYMDEIPGWPHNEVFAPTRASTPIDTNNSGYGHSGLASTLQDGVTFLRALLGGTLLSKASTQAMQQYVAMKGKPPRKAEPNEMGYGLGLVHMVLPGSEMIGHGGNFNGHSAGVFYLPACDTYISVAYNRGFFDELGIYDRIAAALGCASPAKGTKK